MSRVTRLAREIESLMALRTSRALAEKQTHAAPRGGRERVLVAAVNEAIVRRMSRDQRALERRQRARDVANGHRLTLAGKRRAELRIVAAKSAHDLLLVSRDTQLDRMRVEHRHERLLLERANLRAVPRIAGVVAGIRQ